MSQYKDLITGNVITNIRVINNKAVDLSPNKYKWRPLDVNRWENTTQLPSISNIGKFSNQSIEMYRSRIDSSPSFGGHPEFIRGVDFNDPKMTISFWHYSITSTTYQDFSCFEFLFGDKYLSLSPNTNNECYVCICNKNWNTLKEVYTSRTINTWIHYALTLTNNSLTVYQNGIQFFNITDTSYNINSNSTGSRFYFYEKINSHGYWDDIVVITNQLLWNSNFDVPNDYLTGQNTKKITKKMIILPFNRYASFDDRLYCY